MSEIHFWLNTHRKDEKCEIRKCEGKESIIQLGKENASRRFAFLKRRNEEREIKRVKRGKSKQATYSIWNDGVKYPLIERGLLENKNGTASDDGPMQYIS